MIAGRPVHTYSIVALDAASGTMGAAVQSHWFSVGSIVPWARAGVGVVATQAFANPDYGPEGLAALQEGLGPTAVVARLTAADPQRELRQLAVLAPSGEVAVHTGSRCLRAAGHRAGAGYSVQANLMAGEGVWPAMAEAFEEGSGALPERLLRALEAAERCGGDLRGRQSAALLVVRREATGRPWQDRLVDLRVEDHPEPLVELRRLLGVHRAYEHMNRGDRAVERGALAEALAEYSAARELYPDNLEMVFWQAACLAAADRLEEALPLFASVFRANPSWRPVCDNLRELGLLPMPQAGYERIRRL